MLTTTPVRTKPSFLEFVILVSLLMSLTALSIDAMLPALPLIGEELGVVLDNSRQLAITMLFLGLSVGQLFFGPLSDSTGRKPAIFAGLILFMAGSALSMLSLTFPMMLAGRLLQGLGISAPRAATLALVRDQYEGRAMAQVMSFVMTIFIIVPMLAPSMGQAIMLFAGWRAIFGSFILIALIAFLWLALRQPETLAPENRIPFAASHIAATFKKIILTRSALAYTITAGLIMGSMNGYLNSAQQIYQEIYQLGTLFPLYFAAVSSSIGLASIINSRLVMRYGMRLLVRISLWTILILASVTLGVALLSAGAPPLWFFLVFLLLTFFCVGILFGNMNALAMEPLGRVAGTGAAVVGSLSTLIATVMGLLIGQSFNNTVIPFVTGLGVLAALSILFVWWAEPAQRRPLLRHT